MILRPVFPDRRCSACAASAELCRGCHERASAHALPVTDAERLVAGFRAISDAHPTLADVVTGLRRFFRGPQDPAP